MNKVNQLLCILVGLFLCCGLASAGEYYKWVDEDGVTHYTQSPPNDPNVKSETIRASGGKPAEADAARAQKRLDSARKEFMDNAGTQDESKAKAEEEAARKEKLAKNCEIARGNLQTLQTNNQVREKGEDGEFRMLPEEERQKRIQKNQQYVEQNCQDL